MSYESDMMELPIKASHEFIEKNIADTYDHIKQEDLNQDDFDRFTIRYEALSEQEAYAKKIQDELVSGADYAQLDKILKAQADYIDRLKELAKKQGLL